MSVSRIENNVKGVEDEQWQARSFIFGKYLNYLI